MWADTEFSPPSFLPNGLQVVDMIHGVLAVSIDQVRVESFT